MLRLKQDPLWQDKEDAVALERSTQAFEAMIET